MVGSAMVANSTASTSTTTGALQVVGGVGVGGTIYVGGNIIPGANLTSNIGSTTTWFNTFFGVSTQAKYADLAERYASDAPYEPGTVVVFLVDQLKLQQPIGLLMSVLQVLFLQNLLT
jgi:hypothetical protein